MEKRKRQPNPIRTTLICSILILMTGTFLLSWYALRHSDEDDSSGKLMHPLTIQTGTDSPETLQERFDKLTITLKFGQKNERVTSRMIKNWVSIRNEGKTAEYAVQYPQVLAYAETLAHKYDTYEPQYELTTNAGETIRLENKSIGWQFDSEYAARQLEELIVKGESVTLDLTDKSESSMRWWTRAAADYDAGSLRGNVYAEVSLDDQYLWVYRNGVVILESSIVSGNPNDGHETPKGAFVVSEKKEHVKRSVSGDETEAAYWIGFDDGIAFCDAPGQSGFGGTVYLSDGSDGCILLSSDVAALLYEAAYANMPVYVY